MSTSDLVRPTTNALAAARSRAGLSQRELGARVGLAQSHVSKIEHAVVDPQLSSLVELSRALELELMLVPRQLVPAVRALVRQVAPDPRRAPGAVDHDLLRLARKARQALDGFPDLSALRDLAASADELRLARLDDSFAARARSLIDAAMAILKRLRPGVRGQPAPARGSASTEVLERLSTLVLEMRDLHSEWTERERDSYSTPAYSLDNLDE